MATKSRPMSAPETVARAAKNPLKFLGTKARNYSAREGHDWAWHPRRGTTKLGIEPSMMRSADEAQKRGRRTEA
jgi:hypothetical protein